MRLFAALCVGASVFAGISILWALDLFELAELKALDHRFVRYANPEKANRDIVVVAIDEASLDHFEDQLGRWPWPRTVHAYVVDFLKMGGAKRIAFDILFLEPDKSSDEDDENFAASLKKAGNVILPMLFDKKTSGGRAARSSPAAARWRVRSAVNILGRDGSRALPYSGANLPIPALLDSA